MERKVFSHPNIAMQMNALFINIKVDREERPDLDEIYMTATQIMSGSGGWPNSVFLTPDLLPFYAGTYFPPEDSQGRPGFPRILTALHEAWENRPTEVIEQAEKITDVIRRATTGILHPMNTTHLDRKLIVSATEALRSDYSTAYGGFGSAPKFPTPTNLELLLSEYEQRADKQLLQMITHTLDMMAYGGIYDQIGGGFHRYSVDAKWLVPHFEKMLYDNAQLAKIYLQTYRLTKKPLYRRVAEEIFAFVFREMTSSEGGFYSAIDAETDAEEGKYYLWTQEEIRRVLGKNRARLFMKVYGVENGANFDGKNILYLPSPITTVAKSEEKSEDELLEQLKPLKAELLDSREKRKRPLLDTKVIVNWNGLMIDAFALGYEVLGDPSYLDAAQKATKFILDKMRNSNGQLMHTYRGGVVKYDGYLDDYAFFVRGLLRLYQATRKEKWLNEARDLTQTMTRLFWDNENGAFYFTLAHTQDLLVRTKKPYDSAIPSGNAVAANNLLTLAQITREKSYLDRARKTWQPFSGMMAQSSGSGFRHMLIALTRYLSTDWSIIEPDIPAPPALIKQNPGFTSNSRLGGTEIVKASASIRSAGAIQPAKPFNIEVRLTIAEGWHINANPASQEFLIPTTVSLNPSAEVEVLSIDYPKGKPMRFDYTNQLLSVYDDQITIRMQLALKSNKRHEAAFPLDLDIHYQACDDSRCSPPTSIVAQLTNK